MLIQKTIYAGETVDIRGVPVKCVKVRKHCQAGGAPRQGVLLEYDDAVPEAEEEQTETGSTGDEQTGTETPPAE